MQAYEAGLKPSDTRLLLRPDSDFFRYFGNPAGTGRANPPRTSAAPPPPPAPPAQ